MLTRGILYLQGRYWESVEEFLRAINLKSSDALVFYRTGDALLAVGSLEQALSMYKKALSIAPNERYVYERIQSIEEAEK